MVSDARLVPVPTKRNARRNHKIPSEPNGEASIFLITKINGFRRSLQLCNNIINNDDTYLKKIYKFYVHLNK